MKKWFCINFVAVFLYKDINSLEPPTLPFLNSSKSCNIFLATALQNKLFLTLNSKFYPSENINPTDFGSQSFYIPQLLAFDPNFCLTFAFFIEIEFILFIYTCYSDMFRPIYRTLTKNLITSYKFSV